MSYVIDAAILEDEALARRRLERLVNARRDLRLAGSYDNPLHARAVLEGIQLLFLDIEMPFQDGFTFLNSLPGASRPYVIFTTAHERHAVKAFRHDAIDFLLKPFDEATFTVAVDRARRRIRAEAAAGAADRPSAPAAVHEPVFLGVRVIEGTLESLIAPGRIDWIKVEGRRICLSTGGRVLRATGSLAEYEQRLAAHRFLRIHRSTLVNLDRVKAVQSRSHGDRILVLVDGQRLPMSRHFASRFDALTL